MLASTNHLSIRLSHHHTSYQRETSPDVNDLRETSCQHTSPPANEDDRPHTLHSNRITSPNLGALRQDMFSVLVDPSELQKPGLATVSNVHPVQTSCAADWAPPAYCWLTFRYCFCTGNRQTNSPPPSCLPDLAETSSTAGHQCDK